MGRSSPAAVKRGVRPSSVSPGWVTSVPVRAESQLPSTPPQPGSKPRAAPGFTPLKWSGRGFNVNALQGGDPPSAKEAPPGLLLPCSSKQTRTPLGTKGLCCFPKEMPGRWRPVPEAG